MAWWLALWLGCSRGPSVAGTPERVVPVCEPWVTWDLPLEGTGAARSEVVACDVRHLTLRVHGATAEELGPLFRLAVRSVGWEEDVDTTAAGFVNVRYVQGADVLDLSAIDAGHTLVVLTIVEGVAP